MSPSLTEQLASEITRYGSLEAAIVALANDACGASWGAPVHDLVVAALALQAERREAADPSLTARRLRVKAGDLFGHYASHMADYGREIGRAQVIKDPVTAKLVDSAAKAALDEAGDCLTQAIAAEIEAERIESGGFVTIFDGVSVKQRAA